MYKISFTFLFDRDNICIFFFQQEIGYTQACVKQTLLFKDFYKLNTSKRFFGCCNFHICSSCFFFFLNQIMRLSSTRKRFFFNIQPIQRTVSLQRQMIYIYTVSTLHNDFTTFTRVTAFLHFSYPYVSVESGPIH